MTYRNAVALLRQAGVDAPEWDAACLIEHFCGTDRASVPLQPERDYPSSALEHAVRGRAERRPLQYLLGEWPFYRQIYEVSPACLIPRADTETLVERAVAPFQRFVRGPMPPRWPLIYRKPPCPWPRETPRGTELPTA